MCVCVSEQIKRYVQIEKGWPRKILNSHRAASRLCLARRLGVADHDESQRASTIATCTATYLYSVSRDRALFLYLTP